MEIKANDVKNLIPEKLSTLCDDIREKILDGVLKCGGHLSSNLGMVELTVALHYVFNFPKDKLIFDVGHQCYAHKILSGRGDKFDTLRKKNGLSGFPKREESVFDCYNTGHAGTSISAALGMAKARDILGEDYNVIALIGDGSFNNGLIYEAFNSLKPLNSRILVIINDNGMSISPTVGSMHDYLFSLEDKYFDKNKVSKHSDIFEHFGFEYDGVYDGNDVLKMVEKLSEIKEKLKTKSVILHVNTKKGKGYNFCEENPEATHGVSSKYSKALESEYSEVLGSTLCDLANENKNIVVVTAAMTGALGLSKFF
ncbi:MAG: 1-deoxy-D-xylulose-5-phosphate synthase, partial [Clostridia bacterium]|nr:1-deoxy-D-xylulose-5-phosphate synthase [Clostridia bacterium]